MSDAKPRQRPDSTAESGPSGPDPSPRPASQQQARKKKTFYDVSFYHDWCKSCGICMAFCPKKIILEDEHGKPRIADQDQCIGCRFCETHCPDFAITVEERKPKRRKTDV